MRQKFAKWTDKAKRIFNVGDETMLVQGSYFSRGPNGTNIKQYILRDIDDSVDERWLIVFDGLENDERKRYIRDFDSCTIP